MATKQQNSPKGPQQLTKDPAVVSVMREIHQSPELRQPILAQLEVECGGRCVVAFSTSFNQDAPIGDNDADIIEGVLQKSDLSKGLTLIINSPGGSGLAAERIVNVCRSYSSGDFEVMIPKMAKSAATMVAFGAKKIWMSKTSELGPVDPQVFREGQFVSAHSIVSAYQELLRQAVKTNGNIQPYLQQLQRFDASEVKRLKASQKLSESIAITALQTGMMKSKTDSQIRMKIKPFLDPEVTSSHGRRIGMEVAEQCGLQVGNINLGSSLWRTLWELYVRLDFFVSTKASKCVESKDHTFYAPLRLPELESE